MATTRSVMPQSPGLGPKPANRQQHKLKQRFTVMRKLGKGTYGKVQLAINKETGQEVAIKTIRKSKIEDDQDLQRVRREIQIMSSIEHPHIIHIYEVFENKDKIVLVMQYAPGGEMFEYLSQAKMLDDCEARRLFRQIATAIFYCHQNKICHRDLKLENILLDEKNNAKLADFGLSNVFDSSRLLKTFCGSPLYASPEIVCGSPYLGPEVDCWSLGVLLYTLVYGAMPFDGSNFKRLVRQISEANYVEPEARSQASPLIRKLLCADPKRRATIIDICTDPWVNGAIPTTPRTPLATQHNEQNLPETSKQQSHNPLLKVAQDMAKLTPVRLDILLSLTPQSQIDEEPPMEPVAPGKLVRMESKTDLSRSMRMDVDMQPNNDRTSPIASFVVRNLEPEPVPMEDKENLSEPVQLQAEASEPNPEVVVQVEQTLAPSSEDALMMNLPETSTIEVDTNDKIDLISTVQDSLDDNQMEVDKVELEFQAEPETVRVPAQEEQVVAEEAPVMERPPSVEKSLEPQAQEPTSEDVIMDKATEDLSESDKPKKVKKKILVKKKKKVSAKKTQEESCETPEPDGRKSQAESDTSKSTKVKQPGKVQIPGTFQQTPEDASQPTKPEPSNTSRRQSAMIADVSQKLLSQQQQSPASMSAAVIRTDQPQLASVRVSDKKGEFERRTSMAATSVSPTPRGSIQTSGSESPKSKQMQEPIALDSVQTEILRGPSIVGQTIIEPVKLGEPQQISCTLQHLNLPSEDPSNLQTPTGELRRQSLVERQLEDCVKKLTEEFGSTTSSAPLEVEQRDDRSDSVETIKADQSSPQSIEQPEKKKNVRSTLQINLGPARADRVSPQEFARTGSAQINPLAPAPITRSYKKVTFTRDGACITETGKIYSTRADDGTMRTIERKSKVTHYPATDDQHGPASEQTEEEIVYNEADPAWQGPTFRSTSRTSSNSGLRMDRPFERLIMPSAELHNVNFDRQNEATSNVGNQDNRHISRNDSCSSCSSGSTDIFDDIFDSWTGPTGMFNNRGNFANIHSSMMQRAFGHRLRGGHRQFGRSRDRPSSVVGSPRNDSAEFNPHHKGGHQKRDGGYTSGYDSDAPLERPASAMCGARGTFGSSNFFPQGSMRGSIFEDSDESLSSTLGGDFFTNAELEHRRMKKRLAKQQKQLWKGSIPSLFDACRTDQPSNFECQTAKDDSNPQVDVWRSLQQQQPGTSQCTSSSQLPPTFRQRSSSGSNQNSQQTSWPRVDEQPKRTTATIELKGSSSNQSLPKIIPAQSAKAPSSLPPRMMQSPIGRRNPNVYMQTVAESHPASLIEVKRTASSSSNPQVQQQRIETIVQSSKNKVITSTSTSLVGPQSTSRVSPNFSTNNPTPEELQRCNANQQDVDSRIQTWLKNSSGNLSTSSGTKSSTSDTLQLMKESDSFANLSGSSRPIIKQQVAARTSSSKQPINLDWPVTIDPFSVQPLEAAIRSVTISSKSEQATTCINDGLEQVVSCMEQNQQSKAISERKSPMASRALSPQVGNEQIWVEKHESPGGVSSIVTKTGQTSDGLDWVQTIESSSRESSTVNPIACDAESTSSSLLEQLKTQGYRSMINKRIVSESSSNVQDIPGGNAITESHQVSESSFGVAKSDDGSTVEQQTVVTKSSVTSSSTRGGPDDNSDPSAEVPNEASLEQPSANLQPTEVEDLDEDVKEAKAYVKTYLDRMKETEEFLKSMREQEENYEKRRQQLLMFDSLMIGARLNNEVNGYHKSPSSFRAGDVSPEPFAINNGPRSAPAWSMQSDEHKNGFIPSMALSYEPTFTLSPRIQSYNNECRLGGSFMAKPSTGGYVDPLEPVQPLVIHHQPLYERPNYRRSKSQLSDLFDDPIDVTSSTSKRGSSSATIQMDQATNPYFPSRSRRSVSQMRYTAPASHRLSQPSYGSSMMSEYKSAYCKNQNSLGFDLSPRKQTGSSFLDSPRATSPIGSYHSKSEESDDGMREYRASAYVPKVVPSGMPTRQARSQHRRSFDVASSSRSNRSSSVLISHDDSSPETKRERRVSLQVSPRNRSSTRQQQEDSEQPRRFSLASEVSSSTINDDPTKKSTTSSGSRLEELEQRIEANKRRRERLLTGELSPSPNRRGTSPGIGLTRELSPVASASPSRATMKNSLNRPSRLESMEARIKRKSYYIRTDKSEGGFGSNKQPTLEKWKAGCGSSSSANDSPRNSVASISINNLLSSLQRRDSGKKFDSSNGGSGAGGGDEDDEED